MPLMSLFVANLVAGVLNEHDIDITPKHKYRFLGREYAINIPINAQGNLHAVGDDCARKPDLKPSCVGRQRDPERNIRRPFGIGVWRRRRDFDRPQGSE